MEICSLDRYISEAINIRESVNVIANEGVELIKNILGKDGGTLTENDWINEFAGTGRIYLDDDNETYVAELKMFPKRYVNVSIGRLGNIVDNDSLERFEPLTVIRIIESICRGLEGRI